MYAEMRTGNVTPEGGLYLQMSHLGPDDVRRQFPGMVQRCADVGFDLAGGRVEVVPTAHYLMGGVEVAPDCATALTGLYVAGEDAGGIHGANRLGGNGVADSTVFGGVAGAAMADWVSADVGFADADPSSLKEAADRCRHPFTRPTGDLGPLRRRLEDTMWDRVGIVRDADGLTRAMDELDSLAEELDGIGIEDGDRAYHVAWHDRLNLGNLIQASRAIAAAALGRENSCGSHFREDFSDPMKPEDAAFIRVQMTPQGLEATPRPVVFSRVRPGETLIDDQEGNP